MTLTADYLRSTGSVLSEQEFVDALRRLAGPADPPAGAHLSQADESFLAAHGGLGPVDDDVAVSAAAENLVHVARAAVDTLDVEQVAALVGVSESRIRHQIADGDLYSFKPGASGCCRAGSSRPPRSCPVWPPCSRCCRSTCTRWPWTGG